MLTFHSLSFKNSTKCQKDKWQKTWNKITSEVMMCYSKKIISSIKKKDFGGIWLIGTVLRSKVIKEANLLSQSQSLTTVKINLKVKKLNYKRKETLLLTIFIWPIFRKKFKKSKLKKLFPFQRLSSKEKWKKNSWHKVTYLKISPHQCHHVSK